jgi:hypothetical protein
MKRKLLPLISSILFSLSLNAQPNLEWAKTYNGITGSDKSNAIAIDNNCNVYVMGPSEVLGQGYNYLTIKYDRYGDTLWTRTYNAPFNGNDIPVAIAVNNTTGDVFVTGKSEGSGTGYDWLTIKYNSNGIQINSKTYSASSNGDDMPVAMAIDNSGNLIITGSFNDFGHDRAITMKLNGSLTTMLWYHIPFNLQDNEVPKALAIDNAGNSYITGCAYNTATAATEKNIITWALDPSGNEIAFGAVQFYSPNNGICIPTAIGAYGSNKMYVCGTCEGDILLLKYDISSFATLDWQQTYNGAALGKDGATSMKVQNNGDVYLAGYTDVDPVVSTENLDFITLKYNSAGVLQSGFPVVLSTSSNGEDIPTQILLSNTAATDIYVCGTSTTSTNKDFIIAKYNNSGVFQDSVIYNNNGDDIMMGAVRDNFNNIYATGYSGPTNSEEFTTVKYCNNSPNVPTIALQSINIISANATGATAYQWYLNGNLILGATNQTYNITGAGSGSYSVVVTYGTCCTASSSSFSATVGIDELELNGISISPNPASDYIEINTGESKFQNIELSNVLGEIVLRQVLNSKTTEIKLSQFPAGLYELKLISKDKISYSKVLKR